MTLQKLKTDLVDEKKILDKKSFKKLIINALLFIGLGIFSLCIVIVNILNILFTVAVLIFGVFIFSWSMDYLVEDENNTKKAIKIFRLWWIWLIVIVAICFVLSYFNFI